MSISPLPSAWRENEKGLNVSLLCATAKPLAVIRLPSFVSIKFDSSSIFSSFHNKNLKNAIISNATIYQVRIVKFFNGEKKHCEAIPRTNFVE